MISDIILIGPKTTGKSTLGELLAQKLGIPQCSMDKLRWDYYKEINYDEELAKRIREKEGFIELYRYWKFFEAYAVERLLSEHSNCVIDFGGGHSVYEDDELFNRVQRVLESYNNVVLILPSPDLEESIQILNERNGGFVSKGFDFNEHFVKHHSNHNLAKFVVYTKDKTPEETRDEILQIVNI
ncbi:shikimate kinase [Hassallia byssoidea VB512170]|uniref:Shikimate kinase n=1 Tax=Hassallia byssoidea VB512170 TaxID=1304833 RepID=A0A846HBQ3_9CYAN|nr:shikimate kinase [Hassalia byssoidea]NEU74805.1 shikimate kinase [Hassalia byssoidea VB512170]